MVRFDNADKSINRFVEVWRKGLLARLLLLWITLGLLLNSSAGFIAGLVGFNLPPRYQSASFLVVALGFVGWIWLAIIRSKYAKPQVSAAAEINTAAVVWMNP